MLVCLVLDIATCDTMHSVDVGGVHVVGYVDEGACYVFMKCHLDHWIIFLVGGCVLLFFRERLMRRRKTKHAYEFVSAARWEYFVNGFRSLNASSRAPSESSLICLLGLSKEYVEMMSSK